MQKSQNPPAEPTRRSRGRPRGFDRSRALAEATRLFWQKGFGATSVSDLTKALGINAPSLYAAFGSKEDLYAECLRYYAETYKHYVWSRFEAASTARDAVHAFLMDSAAVLTGNVADIPRGCMVALSAVGSEGHAELGELAKSARAVTLERLLERLERAVKEGEIPRKVDRVGLGRFVQMVQYGMSVLARDGAGQKELEAAAGVAMLGWDARVTA